MFWFVQGILVELIDVSNKLRTARKGQASVCVSSISCPGIIAAGTWSRMDTVWWMLEESTPYGVLLLNNVVFSLLRKIVSLAIKERFIRTRTLLSEFIATLELCADVAELGKTLFVEGPDKLRVTSNILCRCLVLYPHRESSLTSQLFRTELLS